MMAYLVHFLLEVVGTGGSLGGLYPRLPQALAPRQHLVHRNPRHDNHHRQPDRLGV
jgi:hypothetical protein